MKNKVLLVLLLSFAVSLAASAQKITMNLQQVKLEKVFSLITKQTGLTVAYSRTIVNPERIVSVQAKDKDLSKVLDDLFAGTNVAYEIGEKKIYLKAKEEGVSKCTPSVFYAQSPDFHKLGLCYYLKILYL